MLEVPGSIPTSGNENFGVQTLSLMSFAGITLDKCIVLSDRYVNWMSPVQGKSHPVQVKEPNGYLDNIGKRVWQYIEKKRKDEGYCLRILLLNFAKLSVKFQ